MKRQRYERQLKGCLIVSTCLTLILCAFGCPASSTPGVPNIDNANALGRAEGRRDAAVKIAQQGADAVRGAKPYFDTIATTLLGQREDLIDAVRANAGTVGELAQRDAQISDLKGQINKLIDQIREINGRWYVIAGKAIEAAFWLLALWIVLVIVLRVLGLVVKGKAGATMAGLSVFLGGPIGWFFAATENLWFRVFSKPAAASSP